MEIIFVQEVLLAINVKHVMNIKYFGIKVIIGKQKDNVLYVLTIFTR